MIILCQLWKKFQNHRKMVVIMLYGIIYVRIMMRIEREVDGDEYKESKKHNYVTSNKEMVLDSQKSILVCTKCGLCEYYPVYVTSYNHSMKPLRRKCIYKRLDNFKVILTQFFYGGKQFAPDDVMNAVRN